MKRIKAACICQTLHFQLKDDLQHDLAVKWVKEEVENYKKTMERKHIQFKIQSEETQPDGSIIVKLIKQYSTSPLGEYLS